MRFGSVCSGIEAASCAWEPLGWSPAWFSEISPFPSRVLAHHHPKVPNHGSLVGLADRLGGDDRHIDVLVGGTPCQSFSIAGLRGGLADGRGNLALEFARLAQALRPRWLLWENVPGVLSSAGGRDFGSILGALVELGYGCAWRVLDARFYGVPQRRRRVFLVGHLGAAAPAGAVLFEPEGVRRNHPTRGEAGQDVAGTLGGGSGGRGWAPDTERMTFIPGTARCLTTSNGRIDAETETFIVASFDPTQVTSPGNRSSCDPSTAPLAKTARPPHIAFNARQGPLTYGDGCGPLDTDGSTYAVCVTGEQTHALRSVGADASEDGTGRGTPITVARSVALRGRDGGSTAELGGEQANALRSASGGASAPMVLTSSVRRLTPRECERLQGFPDDYTAIPKSSDGARYAALGNSMAVPVMAWIGRRIAKVSAVLS